MRRSAVVFFLVLAACAVDPGPIVTTSTTLAAEPTSTIATWTTAPTTIPGAPLRSIAYESVARLDFPVHIVAAPGSDRALVATKSGLIRYLKGAMVGDATLLDIRDRVRNRGEQGLLAIALHPQDQSRLFVHYSATDGDTVVSEFAIAGEGPADPIGEEVLLRLDQPAGNHNGGMIQFGPDGALYLGLGDGGGGGDRYNNGQNTETLLAGLVRIDVDSGAEPELFQYGLRNPWRFWIDGADVYVADVGQNAFEEISVARLAPDVNYGWPIMEGLHCFRPSSGCDTAGLTLPLVEIRHGDAGTCSITGGVVYRGRAIPELVGDYFYSDYCGGYLRSFRYVDGVAVEETDWTDQVGVPGPVVGFGVDGLGEMYVMTNQELLKVVPVRG